MRREVSTIALTMALAGWAGASQAQTAQPAPSTTDLGEILVSGQRGAIAAARAAERNSDNLTNVVSADSVGQFGDQNTAEALQRLPGINIERNEGEGRTVSVRGLPSSFTQVTINGARVGTSEAGSSTVALDVVPSDLLGKIVVSKSYTPDMDGDTIGGAIELQSLSAFDSGGNRTSLRAEGVYQNGAGEWGPKLSASTGHRFMGGDLGVAVTANYSDRSINGDDLRNEEGFRSITRGTETFLYPNELNQRHEIGQRERFGGSLNLEYRPRDNFELYLRGQFTQLNDDDTRIQQLWQTERATGSEVQAISDTTGRFIDVRNRYQVFFQPTEDRLFTASAGGRNQFANDWILTYQADFSRSEWTQEDGLRPRFEIDDVGAIAFYDRDNLGVQIFRQAANRPDPTNLSNYVYTNLLFIEEERIDDIVSGRFDIQTPFGLFGSDGWLKFGAKHRSRDKEADKAEFNGDPRTVGQAANYSQFPLFTPDSGFSQFGPFVNLADLRNLAVRSRDALLATPTFQRQDNTVASDFKLGEDVTAGYLMGNWPLADRITLIGGVRMEHTSFSSQGFFFESDDNGRNSAGNPLSAINLGAYEKDYTNWLPSALVRWEPTEDFVVRGSYGRGIRRPDFDDARNSQAVRFDDEDPANTRQLEAGNPFLEALTADNFDASIAWYPSSSTVVQVAIFHKEIRNFFLDFETNDISQTSIVLPTGISSNFESIETVINGGRASVSGMEVAFSRTFDLGFFFEGNVTLAESEAETSERPGESFPFPGQSDLSGNLSIGWENETFSARVAGNHRGRVLAGISSDPQEDRYRAPYSQLDINVRWNLTPVLQIYADAINVTESKDTRYYEGGRQRLFQRVQDFGASYQVGLRATF